MRRSKVGRVPYHLRALANLITAAFEDFLQSYKSTTTDLDALEDLNLDGDGTSDEYDFMDDVAGGKETRQRNGTTKEPKHKYMDMLQKVVDRKIKEVTIELDDLENVRRTVDPDTAFANTIYPSTKRATTKKPACVW